MEQQVNQRSQNHDSTRIQEWDPRAILKSTSFLEQKIHQLQKLVHIIVDHKSLAGIQANDLLIQQQQLITTDLTSIIVQLVSTAGSLLSTVKHHTVSSANQTTKQLGQFGGILVPSETGTNDDGALWRCVNVTTVEDQPNHVDLTSDCGIEKNYDVGEHEAKDEDESHEEENLSPGSYEILQLEKEEILAPHTHFCTICGKGFKRDVNLRMHMRGHGDEYKTPAALAKPHKEPSSRTTLIKRYSCPCVGCKRNKEHKKFQPLKTILCVKNHYRRTHCEKSYACSRCNLKKFSVIADLRTHEKHCGKDKWICSCGTTFSRKDKLFGHISLFQGHKPAMPLDETKFPSNQGQTSEATTEAKQMGSEVNVQNGNGLQTSMNVKEFETCKLNEPQEFPRPPFEDQENSILFSDVRFM